MGNKNGQVENRESKKLWSFYDEHSPDQNENVHLRIKKIQS